LERTDDERVYRGIEALFTDKCVAEGAVLGGREMDAWLEEEFEGKKRDLKDSNRAKGSQNLGELTDHSTPTGSSRINHSWIEPLRQALYLGRDRIQSTYLYAPILPPLESDQESSCSQEQSRLPQNHPPPLVH
jgi:hypothetical protein